MSISIILCNVETIKWLVGNQCHTQGGSLRQKSGSSRALKNFEIKSVRPAELMSFGGKVPTTRGGAQGHSVRYSANKYNGLSSYASRLLTGQQPESNSQTSCSYHSLLPQHQTGLKMDGDINTEPFPAPFKRVTGTVNGLPTEVELMSFADKIMITVSQGGRLAQWVRYVAQ
jgi:hypothetical protein